MCAKAGNWDQSEGFLTKIDRLNTSIYRFGFLTSRLDLSAAMLILMMSDKSADVRDSKFSLSRGPEQQKNTRLPSRGETLVYLCTTEIKKGRPAGGGHNFPRPTYFLQLSLFKFRQPAQQALGSSGHEKKRHPLRVSLARARSLFRPLLPSACYAG